MVVSAERRLVRPLGDSEAGRGAAAQIFDEREHFLVNLRQNPWKIEHSFFLCIFQQGAEHRP
jgi:hypothetical protein